MIEIVPGIFQIQLPLGGYPAESVNLYLIQGKKEYLLVDAGWNTDGVLCSLQKQLSEIGASLADIKRLIATHCHHDHYDLTGRLKQDFGIRIYLHRKDVQILRDRARGQKFLAQLDAVLRQHGMPDGELARVFPVIPDLSPPVMPDVLLDGGESIRCGSFAFQVIWTPGHTPGQIALYEPQIRILISSDLVLPTISTSTSMHLQYSSNPLGDYLKSLVQLRTLDVKLVLPGHQQVFSGLGTRIDEILRQRSKRNDRILQAMEDRKCRNAYDLAVNLAQSYSCRSNVWDGLTPMERRFTVSETISHLEFLRFDQQMEKKPQKVGRFFRGGNVYYQSS